MAGPSVTLSNPAAEQPTFTAPNVTPIGVTLAFDLTVTDVVGLQDRDDVEISASGINDTPTADAGDDQTVLEQSTVTLDASNSSDPDVDDIMTYQWNQTGGTAVTLSDPTSKLPTFEAPSFNDAGGQPLIFELIVTDGQNEQSQEDSTTVTVTNFEKKNPGASGGGCFIATAAYGSSMDSHIMLLREFRDRFLLTNPVGKDLVKPHPNVADLHRGKTRQSAPGVAEHSLGQVVAYLTVCEILADASTGADGVLWCERSGFCRCGFATLGFAIPTHLR